MTHTDYTKDILNIKDKNVYFYDNCLENVKIKDTETKVFHGYLTYIPSSCPKCGCVNECFDDIIKWSWKRNCKIKIPKVSNYNAILLLDKQRFLCKHCNKTFIASTSLVNPHKQISNNTKTSVILDLMQKGSEKDMALRNNISTNSVNRILNDISHDKYVKNNGNLPSSFGIDEFNATKDTKSKMAFIIINHDKKNIFDINNSRLSKDIDSYFRRYSKKQRDNVKFITMDLYKPYYILMKRLFKNAILIPDRFHIVIQFRNALDKTIIMLCKKSNPNYNKLKKYWKLIIKNEDNLTNKLFYSKHFKKEVSEKYIVTYLLNTNNELKVTYNYYQGLLKSLKDRDKQKFLNIIHHPNSSISIHAKKCNKTLLEMEKYIINAFDYDLSNGIVEGTNNIIKQVKHNACGYRKFSHLKARIMLIKGLYNPLIS